MEDNGPPGPGPDTSVLTLIVANSLEETLDVKTFSILPQQ